MCFVTTVGNKIDWLDWFYH